MTEFNPYNRAMPKECLKSKFFDKVRVSNLEEDAPYKVFLSVDSDDACDYESGTSMKYSKVQLLQMILEEATKTR
jgi:hypothetical protein